MTIITQEEDLVNYDSIKRISSFAVSVSESEESDTDGQEVYVLLAFENNSSVTTEDVIESMNAIDTIDGVIHLGVYGYVDELDTVVSNLIDALKRNEQVFVMPQPNL